MHGWDGPTPTAHTNDPEVVERVHAIRALREVVFCGGWLTIVAAGTTDGFMGTG